jgi:hypothetical protein
LAVVFRYRCPAAAYPVPEKDQTDVFSLTA